jgi:8-oxo-dGTP pyrophosphatase MutT (NUDIX family)
MSSTTGYLRHSKNLNQWNPAHFRPLILAGVQVGLLKPYMCDLLSQWPRYFAVSDEDVVFLGGALDFDGRSEILKEVVEGLIDQCVIPDYLGEPYPVTGQSRIQQFASIDRGAAAYFGIRTYGQHLNGFVKDEDGIKIWIARRAAERIHFPNMLDNFVAGGLPQHLSLAENMVKECWEEAGVPAELASMAQPTGVVSYCRETEIGLKPDTLYCYDLELPADFQPVNTDGEVSEFQLLGSEHLMSLVKGTDEFKPNCNLVLIDFFIRHGLLDGDHEEYHALAMGLVR